MLHFRRLRSGKREQPEHQTLSAPVDWQRENGERVRTSLNGVPHPNPPRSAAIAVPHLFLEGFNPMWGPFAERAIFFQAPRFSI